MALEHNYLIENFDPEVLREYDIRGLVDYNLNENTAYTIGRSFGYVVKNKLNSNKIVTGYDGRLTSPRLHKAVCEGLKASGSCVLNVGLGPTPMIYYSHFKLHSDAAIMVTGSHNPPEYNGFKMVLNKHSFFSEEIKNLQSIIDKDELKIIQGRIINKNIIDNYILRNIKNIIINKPMKIAWDTANGAMGVVINQVASKLHNTENIIINETLY